jgi:23S rRNA pseudouridine1911/1915/1917 synthase
LPIKVSERQLVFTYEGKGSQRLDVFLTEKIEDLTRTRVQALIKDGLVLVEGVSPSKSGIKLDVGDTVSVTIPPIETSPLIPENIPLDILYEDKNVIVIDKSAGMVVHPSLGHDQGTLIHAILGHDPKLEGVGGVQRPGLVHRLDKDTSGVIILAKNDASHQMLQAQFKKRETEKTYLALVDGRPKTPQGRIEATIGRDPRERKRMAIVPEDKGRMAISEYRTREQFDKHTLLEVEIHTGRTHQIRVHMAFMGCPIVGDSTYGRKKRSVKVKRQLLHAWKLAITLPEQKEPKEFIAPLPNDFEHALANLRKGH